MNQDTIWLPGAGGPAAIGVIKSLRLTKSFNGRIICSDASPISAGFFLADKSYVTPPIETDKYLESALNLVKKEKIKVVLPTSGFDIIPLSQNKKLFEALKVVLAFSDASVIDLTNNKFVLMEYLKKYFKLADFTNKIKDAKLPSVVKPIHGKGSRNIFICHTKADLAHAASKIKPREALIQEYLPGTEYTIDVLSDLKGKSLLAVVRERIETRGGISSKGRVVNNPKIRKLCMAMADKLNLIGISCFQMKENKDGEPMLLEVNPRVGGGMIISTLAGANLPLLCLKSIAQEKIEIPKIKQITVLRYFEDVIFNSPPPEI